MWLLHAETKKLEYVVDERTKPYAILSHTWEDDEVTFQDIKYDLDNAKRKKGYQKLRFTCQQALEHSLEYVWIDTCCINKESSAELSEAINSMFRYYSSAKICYAFLCDAAAGADSLKDCRWFTRGWCLQELLAPPRLYFYGPGWSFIGNKAEHASEIGSITRIDRRAVLSERSLNTYSVATKMSWAANRETSRIEDRAYSLMGMFNVNMPLIYGEGPKAFQRLQREIINTSTDQSIFVWHARIGNYHQLLADSPEDFQSSSDVVEWRQFGTEYTYQLSNRGLEIRLPIIACEHGFYFAILQCRTVQSLTGPVALPLKRAHPHDLEVDQLTLCLERYVHPFCGVHGADVEEQPLGLTYIPLEVVKTVRLRSVSIMKDRRDARTGIPWPTTFGITMWPKVWIQTEDKAEHSGDHRSRSPVSETFPPGLWPSENTFDSTTADTHSGLKLWQLETGAYFVLAFRVCPREPGDDSDCLHMAIAQPPGMLDYMTSKHEILDELLRNTEASTMASAHFGSWRDVHACAKLTHRMGEMIYIITVTITRPTNIVPEALTALRPRKT